MAEINAKKYNSLQQDEVNEDTVDAIELELNFANNGVRSQDIKKERDELLAYTNEIEEGRGIYTATELLNRNIESIPCLVDPILPKYGVAGLGGGSDAGKSCLLRQLAIDVCIGETTFLGFPLKSQHNRCIYVTTEDDEYAISFLLNKANKSKRLPSNDFCRLSFIFDTNKLTQRLENQVSLAKVDLIIIDAFADLYGKSMNETNQIRTFLNEYSQFAQKHRCLIIFLHHTGKRTEDLIPNKNNLLGSQGFEAKMRVVFELRLDPFDSTIRHLCIVKANYLSREYKTKSFVLRFDENLQFSMTDQRRLFEELKASNKVELKEQVRKLKEEGKTQIEIANDLNISQSTVSRYLNE